MCTWAAEDHGSQPENDFCGRHIRSLVTLISHVISFATGSWILIAGGNSMKKFSTTAGWLSLISGFTALLFYIVLPDLKTLVISLVLISLFNGIFFLYVEGSSIKKIFSSRSAQHGTNAVILISVLLGFLKSPPPPWIFPEFEGKTYLKTCCFIFNETYIS